MAFQGAWTEANVEYLELAWSTGRSAEQIAKTFRLMGHEHVTKNSVIGKLNRLGLLTPKEPPPPPPLMRLTNCACTWPLGHPGEETFRYCGKPARSKSSYCEEHHHRAHVPRKPPEDVTPFRREP